MLIFHVIILNVCTVSGETSAAYVAPGCPDSLTSASPMNKIKRYQRCFPPFND